MVVKQTSKVVRMQSLFESRVILDGSQTNNIAMQFSAAFESRVILDGSQTMERS